MTIVVDTLFPNHHTSIFNQHSQYQSDSLISNPTANLLPTRKVKVKKSFTINHIKSSNDLTQLHHHPLEPGHDIILQHHDFDLAEEEEEDSGYESDEVSCTSLSCSSNFSTFGENTNNSFDSSYTSTSNFTMSGSTKNFLPPTVMSPLNVYTPFATTTISCSNITTISIPNKSLRKMRSTDSLYLILKKSSSSSMAPKKSVYSNLSSSLRSFKYKISSYHKEFFVSFLMDSPRLTDDKLPKKIIKPEPIPEVEEEDDEEKQDEKEEEEETRPKMQELTTFKASNNNQDTLSTVHHSIKYKTREHRCSGLFLPLYAFDRTARVKSMTLPITKSTDELKHLFKINPQLKSFHYDHNIHRVSNLSREKLWNNVLLPPRNDDSPGMSINGDNYIYIDDDDETSAYYSIVRKNGTYLPWALKQSIEPAGVLHQGKWMFNSRAPNSGISKSQFTVKGWCNPRWIDSSDE